MSQKQGILFSEKSFCQFQGVPISEACPKNGGFNFPKTRLVLFGGCIVRVLGHFGAFWGVLCPKNGVPCFRKKAFANFRGCPFRRHVLKTGYLVFRKQGWPFLGGCDATALFIVAFICIKLHPRIIVCGVVVVTLCFLPPGNRMRGGKRHLSAQREYHR
jgi:hypothetical protein